MLKVDWNELLSFYNAMFDASYVKVKTMLKNGYKKFGGLREFSLKLGISYEALRLKLIKEGIQLNKVGKGSKNE